MSEYIPEQGQIPAVQKEFETFEREGFTVVEWGGSEIH